MGLLDAIKSLIKAPEPTPHKRKHTRAVVDPARIKANVESDLIRRAMKGNGVPGFHADKYAAVVALKYLAPDGDIESLIQVNELLTDDEYRNEWKKAKLEEARNGGRRRRKGSGEEGFDDYRESELDTFLRVHETMRVFREEEGFGDAREGLSSMERLMDNLTHPNGIIAKAIDKGLPAGMMGGVMGGGRRPPQDNTQVQRPPELQPAGQAIPQAPLGPGQSQSQEDAVFEEMAEKIIGLFDVSLPAEDAAQAAWGKIAADLANANMFKRVAVWSALNSITQMPPEEALKLLGENYGSNPKFAPALQALAQAPEWLAGFFAKFQELFQVATAES